MKKLFTLFSVAALVSAAFVSCNKVEEENAVSNEQPSVEFLTFAIAGNNDTKAILGESGGKFFGQWEDGDKLGSVTTKSYGSSSIDASSLPVTFKVYSSGGLEEGNTINLWYPYVANQSDATAVPMSIPTNQFMVGGDFDFSAMPMVAEEITVTAGMVSNTSQTPVDVVGFYNLGSLIHFQVFAESSYTTEKVISVTLNGSSALAGDFAMNVKAVDPSDDATMAISGYTATSVTTNVVPYTSTVGTEATPLDVFMVVAPGSYSGSVVVVTDVATYTWPISSAQDFARSGIRTINLKLDKPSATRVVNVKGSFSFFLDRVSYDSASDASVVWSFAPYLTMTASKETAATAPNSYLPPERTSTRFYKNSALTFTPSSYQIEKIEYCATTSGYATALNASTWSNATSSADDTVVTIVPTDGSSEFGASAVNNTTGTTEIKVYYDNTNYTITKDPGVVGGSIAVSGNLTSAKVNTTITLVPTPASGYVFTSWTVTDAESNPVTVDGNDFQMPASNVTVSATFTSSSSAKAINIPANSHGTITTDPENSATSGAEVTITVTPNDGYALFSLSVVDEDSIPVAVTNNTFTMPNKEVTITAVFYPYVSWTATTGSLGAKITAVNGTANGTINLTGFGGTPSYQWSYTRTLEQLTSGKEDYVSMSGGYMQLGSSNALESIVFTTSNMSTKKIKKIIVDTYCNGGTTHKISATVGSTSYIAETNLTSSGTEYTGTGDTKGNVTVNLATRGTTKKALYVKTITILYDDSE